MPFTPFQNQSYTDFGKPENAQAMRDAIAKVRAEAGKEYPLIIAGERITTSEKFQSINPSKKDEVLGVFQKGTPELVDKAVNAAAKAFESWKRTKPETRAVVLQRAAEIMKRRRHELSATMVLEAGKNWAEADADTAEAIDFLEFYAREMIRYSQPQPLTPIPTEFNEYFYIPLGVGAIIPPWNFPLAILCGMSSAAVVTGNTIVLKPSSETPLIAYKYVEIMEEAGVPPGVINFLTGPGSRVGDPLVLHPKTRFIAFTGSMEVGLRINELAAKKSEGQIWIKRVIAEMGGKDTIIIDEDLYSFDDAVSGVVTSAFGYQGQKCSACSRLIVHQKLYKDFADAVVEKTKALKVGPAEENPNLGPVIGSGAFSSISGYIEIGKGEGRLATGGTYDDSVGFFIQPTVFLDVPETARIYQEEIFGPVLAVSKAKDFDEALRMANNSIYGLTGSVYSKNRWHLEKAREEFHVGNLYFNRKCTGALVDVHPFGGFNMSGTDSKAGGRDYLLLFLQGKSVSERLL